LGEGVRRTVSGRGGQSFTEYVLVTMCAVLILTQGNPGALDKLFGAMKTAYQGYFYAISKSAPQPDWVKK